MVRSGGVRFVGVELGLVRSGDARRGRVGRGLDTWCLVLRVGSIPAVMYGPLGREVGNG